MSNHIYSNLKYALEQLSTVLTPDDVFISCMFLITITCFVLLAYKLSSTSADILFNSKNVIRYMTVNSEPRLSTINYLMKTFPDSILIAWNRARNDRENKPSTFLNVTQIPDCSNLEKTFYAFQRFITILSCLLAISYSLTSTIFVGGDKIIFPLIIAVFAMLGEVITKCVYVNINSNGEIKFKEMIRKLNFYHYKIKLQIPVKDNGRPLNVSECIKPKSFTSTIENKSKDVNLQTPKEKIATILSSPDLSLLNNITLNEDKIENSPTTFTNLTKSINEWDKQNTSN